MTRVNWRKGDPLGEREIQALKNLSELAKDQSVEIFMEGEDVFCGLVAQKLALLGGALEMAVAEIERLRRGR